eukprot:587161-Rhodomonas_salina.1
MRFLVFDCGVWRACLDNPPLHLLRNLVLIRPLSHKRPILSALTVPPPSQDQPSRSNSNIARENDLPGTDTRSLSAETTAFGPGRRCRGPRGEGRRCGSCARRSTARSRAISPGGKSGSAPPRSSARTGRTPAPSTCQSGSSCRFGGSLRSRTPPESGCSA